MNEEYEELSESIKTSIESFNSDIKSKGSYKKRRKTLNTDTIFFDFDGMIIPQFHLSPPGWCEIKPEMYGMIIQNDGISKIIKFESNEESKFIGDTNFFNNSNAEKQEYLVKLSTTYLKLFTKLETHYSPTAKQRVVNKINELLEILEHNPTEITFQSKIIEYLHNQIEIAENIAISVSDKHSNVIDYNEKIQKVLELRKNPLHTVSEICKMVGISQTTYYTYCKRQDKNLWQFIKPKGNQKNEFSLQEHEKKYIKKIVDDPHFSYTVSQIQNNLNSKFNRNISKSKIYSYLHNELNYTYKKNSYATPPAFDTSQIIVRFKVCKLLIGYYLEGKNVIFIDESGLSSNISHLYSFSKAGTKPYRIGKPKSSRLNFIMAINSHGIFGYQVRQGPHNEHSYISFIQDLIRKVKSFGPEYAENTIFYCDNHPAHKSELALRMISFFGIRMLFAPIAYYQINPIELVFSQIKRIVKKSVFTNM